MKQIFQPTQEPVLVLLLAARAFKKATKWRRKKSNKKPEIQTNKKQTKLPKKKKQQKNKKTKQPNYKFLQLRFIAHNERAFWTHHAYWWSAALRIWNVYQASSHATPTGTSLCTHTRTPTHTPTHSRTRTNAQKVLWLATTHEHIRTHAHSQKAPHIHGFIRTNAHTTH